MGSWYWHKNVIGAKMPMSHRKQLYSNFSPSRKSPERPWAVPRAIKRPLIILFKYEYFKIWYDSIKFKWRYRGRPIFSKVRPTSRTAWSSYHRKSACISMKMMRPPDSSRPAFDGLGDDVVAPVAIVKTSPRHVIDARLSPAPYMGYCIARAYFLQSMKRRANALT